ncbi:MAG TPA: sialidase family protein [Thermoanaerobaculia bacterium]|nr:sialidase family protein [Thermoanaerobaculia bacterium]
MKTRLVTLALATAESILLAACRKHPGTLYRFEPEPRAALSETGAAAPRYPALAADRVASGTVFVLAATGDETNPAISFFLSDDGGDSFGSPIRVSAPGSTAGAHGENAPRLLVIDDGPIYAAWNEAEDIRVARSDSFGANFEAPVRVSDRPDSAWSGYVSIGAAPNGDLYAVWLDTRDADNAAGTFSVYLARSTNQGRSFGSNVRVARDVCPCCRPALAFGSGGEVLVFWRKVYPGSVRDMTAAVTRDGGRTFAPSRRIAEDGWRIEGCPDSGPATATVGRRIYAAWLTEAAPDRNGVRLSYTDDGGSTWSPARTVSQKVLDANYPSLSAADDGRMVLAFQGRDPDRRGGWAPIGGYVVEIRPDGTFSAPEALPAPANHSSVNRPIVSAGPNGRVLVAWTGTEAGKQTIFLERGRRWGAR